MGSAVRIDDSGPLPNAESKGSVFEDFCIMPRPKEPQILKRATITMLFRQLVKISAVLDLLNKILKLSVSLCNCLASSGLACPARHRISRSCVLDKQV